MRPIYVTVLLVVVSGAAAAPSAQETVGGRRAPDGDVPKPFQFLFEGFVPSGGLSAAWAGLPFDTISLERTTCFGACPAYKLTFYRGGTTKPERNESYDDAFGRAELTVARAARSDNHFRGFPEADGNFDGSVDIWTFARLSYLIQKSVLRLDDKYARPVTDVASTIVSVSGPGVAKSVLDYGGAGPIELWSVQQAIDSAAKSAAWKRR